MAKRDFGTEVSEPIVAGNDTDDNLASFLGHEGQGAFQRFATMAELNAWTAKYTSRLFGSTAFVETGSIDNKPAFYKWSGVNDDGSDGAWDLVTQIDSSIPPAPAGSGVTLDDGASQMASIDVIKTESLRIAPYYTDPADPATLVANTAVLTPFSTFSTSTAAGAPAAAGVEANKVDLVFPLELATLSDPNSVAIKLKKGTFEERHNPSYLAYLSQDLVIVHKGRATAPLSHILDGKIWFDYVVHPSGQFILTDRANKTIGIQEFDGLDPNVTGGTDFLIAFRAHFRGTAKEAGSIKIYMVIESEAGPQPVPRLLKDKYGRIMGAERHYDTGDELGSLLVLGVVNAKNLIQFSCHVMDTFELADSQLVLTNRATGASGLMIQSLTSEEKTGIALQQFESDTAQNIRFTSFYMGAHYADVVWIIKLPDSPVVEGAAGKGEMLANGWRLSNNTAVLFGTTGTHLHFEAPAGVATCDFSFGKIFHADETGLMHGKEITANIVLTNKLGPVRLAMLKWTGKPDKFTSRIYGSRHNSSITLDPGWESVGNIFIAEDAIDVDRQYSHVFIVPEDAVNIAVIFYPGQANGVMNIDVKAFYIDVAPPENGYILHAPELLSEEILSTSAQWKTFVQDNQGLTTLSYDVSLDVHGAPMPVGIPGKGSNFVSLDDTKAQITGSKAKGGEGALVFSADGIAEISTTLRLTSTRAVTETSNVSFFFVQLELGGGTAVLRDSTTTFEVKGGTSEAIFNMRTFNLNVGTGDEIALYALTDAGVVQLSSSSPSKPSVEIKVHLTSIGVTADDPYANLDLTQFDQVYSSGLIVVKEVQNASDATIPIAIPAGADLVVLSIVKLTTTGVEMLRSYDYHYTAGNLIIAFGETATVKITLGIYL